MRLPFSSLLRWKSRTTAPTAPVQVQRRHPRLPFSGCATLCWTEDGRARESRADLINASEGGMAVTSRRPLPVGARVWILLPDGTDGRAEVRYSNPRDRDHQVGLKFIAEERPSRHKARDAHSVLEWIDPSNRLAATLVSLRNAAEGELEVLVPEVVPCPAIVLLSAHEVRCLCCTRDWRPEGDSYLYRVEVISEAFPNKEAAGDETQIRTGRSGS
jgi:hypothetical protein